MSTPGKDQHLIQGLIALQPAVWSQFIDSYQRLVMARIRNTALQCQFELDQSELDDLCAEVFTCLLGDDRKALRNFRGDCRLSTWLSVIARRVCLRRLTQIRQSQSVDWKHHLDGSSGQHDALAELIRVEQQEQIQFSMESLGETDRKILDLYFNEELSYEEIAERVGVSVNSVGPKLNRAVSRLRKLLRWV